MRALTRVLLQNKKTDTNIIDFQKTKQSLDLTNKALII